MMKTVEKIKTIDKKQNNFHSTLPEKTILEIESIKKHYREGNFKIEDLKTTIIQQHIVNFHHLQYIKELKEHIESTKSFYNKVISFLLFGALIISIFFTILRIKGVL